MGHTLNELAIEAKDDTVMGHTLNELTIEAKDDSVV